MSAPRSLPGSGPPEHSHRPDLPTSASLTLEDVRQLAEVMREFDLAELEIGRAGGDQLRLRRASAAPAPAAPPPAAIAAPPPAPTNESELRYITSPFVGTFYRAPGPEAPAFVEAGQRVRKGQALCIIEAMKLMNELEAEFECTIVECLAENGRPVEYGERLFSARLT